MLWFSRNCLLVVLTAVVLSGALAGYRDRAGALPSAALGRKGERSSMLEYMKDKYGEDFTEGEACAGQTGKDYAIRRVYGASCPGKSALVRVMGKEEAVFQDNYLALLLQDEIEERIGALAGKAFGECKVYYKIPELFFPPEFPADMEVDAFLRHPLSMVRIYIYVKEASEEKENQMDRFLAALTGKGYIAGGVVSYPAGEEMYEMITAEDFTGDIYQGYERQAEAVFSMDQEGGLSYLRWLPCK